MPPVEDIAAALAAAGHPESKVVGVGLVFPAYSEGFIARPCLRGPHVEILHIGAEDDDARHLAMLRRYRDALAPLGHPLGVRILGAGRACLLVGPDADGIERLDPQA